MSLENEVQQQNFIKHKQNPKQKLYLQSDHKGNLYTVYTVSTVCFRLFRILVFKKKRELLTHSPADLTRARQESNFSCFLVAVLYSIKMLPWVYFQTIQVVESFFTIFQQNNAKENSG